jgi:hypothetical protein
VPHREKPGEYSRNSTTPSAGVVYVSISYATAVHRCCCGCGGEVVTPLSPTDWTLIFDGEAISRPSIGNWSFSCQSHYWIRRNTVEWAPRWSKDKIAAARLQDRASKELAEGAALGTGITIDPTSPQSASLETGWLGSLHPVSSAVLANHFGSSSLQKAVHAHDR